MKNNSKFYKKFFFSLIIIFTSFILRTKSNSYSDTLEIVAQFNITKVKTDKGVEECPNCMPAGIKLSKNGTILCSFPRWFDGVLTTLAVYNREGEYFEPWPSLEVNNNSLNSVLGFEIDSQDSIYILDQGKIKGEAAEGSIKLVKYSLSNNSRLREYIFSDEIADRDFSFLNDVVIDEKKNIAYISDSGIANDGNISHYKPGIIVLDLNDESNVHRILTDHVSVFPDESFFLHIDGKPVNNETNPMMTGADGIALSCDGEVLFYCPLTGRMIYSILTKDIDLAIKKGNTSDIKVYEGFKKEASDGLLASSKGNLYMTGIETGSVYIAEEIEKDLLRFDYRDFDGYQGDNFSMWPDTLAIYDGYLYFVTNQLNNFPNNINYTDPKNGKYNFAILKFSVGNDDSYIKGCSGLGANWGIGTIIIWICFAVIILIVLSFVLMGSNNQEEVIDKHMNLGVKED